MARLIEFSGTPDAGKTTLINSLFDSLKSSGLNVIRLGEANGAELPPQDLRGSLGYNEWVGKSACDGILDAFSQNPDLIIADRGFVDFRFWNYFYQSIGKATPQEVKDVQGKTQFQNELLIPDLFVAVTVSLEEAFRRHPALSRKQDWVQQHNNLFEQFYESYKGNKLKIDTSDLSKEELLSKAETMVFSAFPELSKKINKDDKDDIEI